MENLISLVNKLQQACTALGDHGEESALPTLWDSLPSIAVVGGQVLVSPSLARVLGWFLSDLVLPPSCVGRISQGAGGTVRVSCGCGLVLGGSAIAPSAASRFGSLASLNLE
jgi:hypothetical protein